MNREPSLFEYIKFLVDAAHVEGHKKMKKPDNWDRGGHSGCNDGYNFKLYKDIMPVKKPNSQGREQENRNLERLKPTLRMLNYEDYIHILRVFVGLNNLRKKGDI